MKSYDNNGRLVSEITTAVTGTGTVVTTHTAYNTHSGRSAFQNVSVRTVDGKVSVTEILNGKLLP